ncbi:DUF2500 domain-containing protein [Bacillus sp. FJAT-49711]|uniref:DUF2500 domain-containing protein n=1 Tax=Bacillus sp. FJAT-49711 TaxID=2833585 RepID=UPI001BC9D778|nr:DUF2500 domain-containing protein [Bacillus sp. FJAT-49711]MBS4218267.1 DUF2500 domain-containing protein [Bacillus sp. FJAT-49711]
MDGVSVGGFGNSLFDFAPIFIFIVFAIVIISIIVNSVKGVQQWQENEQSPRLSVPAIVKSKRTQVSRHTHMNGDNMHSHHTSTSYFVTFEFESGDRTEFKVSGKEYGLLAESDTGILTFQGTRYLGFERNVG